MKISLKDQAKISTALPMQCAATFTGSALPLEFVDIPGEIGGAAVVAVAATITNADGAAATAPCEHAAGVWRVTFAASCFEHYGFVERGVSVALTLRDGSGNERGMVLAVGDLEVKRSSPSAAPGDPEKSYQIKGEDIFVKTRVIDDVQHYARQQMSYDAEMGAWGADWLGDYILVDGEFVPFQAAGGTAATVATALLALLLVPFSAFGITAMKEYVDRKDGEVAALSTNIVTTATNAVLDAARGYTDTAISQIPPPDFSPSNATLVATIEATSPAPGDYANVSNKAMTALQEHQSLANYYTKSQVDTSLSTKANDNAVVKLTGNQTIEGEKIFKGRVEVWEEEPNMLFATFHPNCIEFSGDGLPRNYLYFPNKTGTLAMASDIPNISGKADKADVAAAASAATNYTDEAISPTSPAFSNAVLSVGLGIDTNTVAVINELVDSAHDLPVTGATSVGALLLALAAAVAALKKRLPYALVEKTIENGAVTLDDRASNAVEISATLSPNTLTINFPAEPIGKARDFALRLNIASGVTAPELVLPQGVVCENADGEVPEISDGGTGGSSTILYFSETENNGTTAKFLLKGETLAAITQA